MLWDGIMLMLAGVYDGQRPTLNIDVLMLMPITRLQQGNPRLQGPCQVCSGARLERTIERSLQISGQVYEPLSYREPT
ncbi:hypothetical protein PoB_004263000 [Plakobranchus ocellatus]|uniref:Uncharacterized protein n=1 Tax=Plakobranchus ocellatus TaxID=259542 RepID=A0AAV4BAK6_9GAST|nr:hypothetical protein PoB_004263000 [Plakobranchus ocellatus]